jgi:hypothetical protein
MTRCPHSSKDARGCSQCLGVKPRRVTVVDHVLCLDGQPTGRAMDDERRQVTARKTARFRRRT